MGSLFFLLYDIFSVLFYKKHLSSAHSWIRCFFSFRLSLQAAFKTEDNTFDFKIFPHCPFFLAASLPRHNKLLPPPLSPAMRLFLLASLMIATGADAAALPAVSAVTAHMIATYKSGGGAERVKREGSFKIPLHRRETGITAVKSIEQVGPVWATPVKLGDQELSVLIDTGSADL